FKPAGVDFVVRASSFFRHWSFGICHSFGVRIQATVRMNFFTELKEGLLISWDAIRANKMRSILTTLGIVIGIVTVTLMGTAIQGLDRAFLNSISSLGADVLYVQRWGWFINSYEQWLKVQKRRKITMPQVKAIEKQLTMARAVAP